MIKKGKITSWNDDKGYGFITPSSGEGQVFAHIKAFKYQARRPEVNRLVTYILSTDKQGRICAAEVIMSAAPVVEKNDQGNKGLSIIFAGLFLVFVAICGLFDRVPSWAFVLYLSMSLITFVFYACDKSAAQKGAWRTPESTLHLLALFGGWPGATRSPTNITTQIKKEIISRGFLGHGSSEQLCIYCSHNAKCCKDTQVVNRTINNG